MFPPRSGVVGDISSDTLHKSCLCMLLTYLLNYLLIPCIRVLLEKLTGFQLVKKSPAFYGTRKFTTALTSACYLSLS